MIVRSPFPDAIIPDTPFVPYVLRHAERLAAKPALLDGATGRLMTYGQLDADVRRVAANLAQRGFRKGDVLAIYSPNALEFVVPLLAAGLLGGAATTVNPLYTAAELTTQLRDAHAQLLFTVSSVLEKALEAAQRAAVREVFVFDQALELAPAPPGGAGAADVEAPTTGTRTTSFAALLQGPASPVDQVAVDVRDDVVALPYSSGTTGVAKGVMLTHRNLVANLVQMSQMGIVTEQDTVVGVLPFYHIYGITVILALGLANGATIVSLPRFDLVQFLATLQGRRVTVGFVAPPIALALAKQPIVDQYDLTSLRVLMSAAAPLGKEIQEACAARLKCLFIQAWGMTETSPDVTMEPLDPERLKPGAVGVCVPNSECKVVDLATGAELGPNEQGEVCARGPQIMKGYLNNPTATAAMLEADGWLHTGDIGFFDEDGHLYVVDRLKELIKYKGYQVAPAELEALLLTHPAVADAAVIPVPDEEVGEVPKALVALKPGASARPEELMAFVAGRVAPFKRVRQLAFLDAVPKSASGKILRRVLIERERAAAAERTAGDAGGS
jgi:acyl-CoA synthetase (AMP-forming)/AMP-acid ligase II